MDWTTCVAFSPAAQQLTGAASEQTSSHLQTWEGRVGERERGSEGERRKEGERKREMV